MRRSRDYNLGIIFRREQGPENLPAFAQKAEAAGYDELWVVEDCFYASGIVSAAAALACTDSIRVGIGIMPAVVRNPVFTAMEIATLARLFPGRLLPGIGHGVAAWMRQIGALPPSQLKALEEVVVTTRKLLAGETLSFSGAHVHVDRAQLVHPPVHIPPISLGVRGPKSLALSGRIADGTILAEYAPPAYVAWARQIIDAARQEANRQENHRLTVFAFASLAEPTAQARRQIRPLLASAITSGKIDAHITPMGILPQVKALVNAGAGKTLEESMPDAWIDQLVILGSPDQWNRSINGLVEAGAETVVLSPFPGTNPDECDRFAQHLGGIMQARR